MADDNSFQSDLNGSTAEEQTDMTDYGCGWNLPEMIEQFYLSIRGIAIAFCSDFL